ncbi:hypothetical protein L227DRAFT_295706 [Lentinus tigrinus ALCF2SS1-6]|uniref:Uncharacterized protein n=1 Tax=Lentinus tigrinus ALCF2SS1-6 TaxID=1328759 RepID=A0A5C2RXX4_9APHY|nr:hypothetical protein L227DRAFT_295706 [Lentinus tigrinus ALCF2SS1-6]
MCDHVSPAVGHHGTSRLGDVSARGADSVFPEHVGVVPARLTLANGLPTGYASVVRDLCERYDHDIWIDGLGHPFALEITIWLLIIGSRRQCADAFMKMGWI